MTRGVWRDPQRYLDAYWSRFPGIWVHGDWASVDDEGYWYLHGRSDDTLNIAGKRIGPAEFESAAVEHPAVVEACAIGVPDPVKGEVAWLYCVAAGSPSAQLATEVAATLRDRDPGQGVCAGAGRVRAGAAEDALGEDRPPRCAGGGAGPRRRATSRRWRIPRCWKISPTHPAAEMLPSLGHERRSSSREDRAGRRSGQQALDRMGDRAEAARAGCQARIHVPG